MNASDELHHFACPYCGQPNSCTVDAGEIGQTLIQDCWVCCRPIEICTDYDPTDDTYALRVQTDLD